MNAADFAALAPHLVLAGGIVLVLLVISFLRRPDGAYVLSVVILAATLAILLQGLDQPSEAVSNLLVVDGYARFLSALFVVAALTTAILARGYLVGRGGEQEEFYLLVLLATLGAMVMAAAQHFAALLLGMEVLSISLYVLIGYSEEGHPPLEASIKYLILSGVASTTMLFGIALVYNATGSLNLEPFAETTGPRGGLYLLAGQTLVFAGLAFKLSLVPFHMWTPDVYQGAPAPITGYLATVSKGAAFAFLLRYALDSRMLHNGVMPDMIILFAVLSMIIGNLLALMQDNVKRILAYSSIAHLGYLLIGLIALSALDDAGLALEASLVYLTGYVLMTLAAFGVVTMLSSPRAENDADDMAVYVGLFWRRPVLASVMTVALLSLTGIPLTAGFIIKFYLFAAGVAGALWIPLWALVIGSAVAVFYYLKIILAMARSAEGEPGSIRGVYDGVAVLVIIGVSLISFGVFPSPLIEVVREVLQVTN